MILFPLPARKRFMPAEIEAPRKESVTKRFEIRSAPADLQIRAIETLPVEPQL